MEIAFAKGHGTGNDFVLIADPEGRLSLDRAAIRTLADRHVGIGGDGVIIARPTRHMPAAEREHGGDTEWFMDYWNADGSASEMCGNGVRVFAQFLREEGLSSFDSLRVGTRAGIKTVDALDDGFAADLGPWTIEPDETLVSVPGLGVARPGLRVSTGNPHVVVALADDRALEALDLSAAPTLDPALPDGANVEFVVPGSIDSTVGRIRMRVHERGSGETLSCGTGAVAAAMATRYWAGGRPDRWIVDVPGGTLGVDVEAVDGIEHAWLSGPAEIVYRGVVSLTT